MASWCAFLVGTFGQGDRLLMAGLHARFLSELKHLRVPRGLGQPGKECVATGTPVRPSRGAPRTPRAAPRDQGHSVLSSGLIPSASKATTLNASTRPGRSPAAAPRP